jgi:hypothetical protein
MRRNCLVQSLTVVSLLTMSATTCAQAQTKPKEPTTTSAFHKLSLGNQKVAAALFQAQRSVVVALRARGLTPASRPLALEEIAARRRGGEAWGKIFREMKALGLVQDKSLGQVVAKYQQTADAPLGVVASDNSGGGSNAPETGSNGFAGGAAHGVVKGGK